MKRKTAHSTRNINAHGRALALPKGDIPELGLDFDEDVDVGADFESGTPLAILMDEDPSEI